MGTITTGVGLISGLPIQDLVKQLIAIEARPRDYAQQQLQAIQAQRTAYLDINARLLAVKNAIKSLNTATAFRAFAATSSNSNIATATVADGAAPGSLSFVVKSLVASHQIVTRGVADADAAGLGNGTVTVEVGQGFVDRATRLDELNGLAGVQRGNIRITDRSGASAVVDLGTAVTVQDVINAIHDADDIRVAASVRGDALVLTDQSGGTGTLIVEEVSGGKTAAGLGLLGSSTPGSAELVGQDVRNLSGATPLRLLNDRAGVGVLRGQNDLRITVGGVSFDVALDGTVITGSASSPERGTRLAQLNHGTGIGQLGVVRVQDRSGHTAEIDLSVVDRGLDATGLNQTTVQDVIGELNTQLTAAGVSVKVEIGGGGALKVLDTTPNVGQLAEDSRRNLKIEDVSGSTTAGLGLLIDQGGTAETLTVTGRRVFVIDTIGDVLRAIEYHPDNSAGAGHVSAAVAGNGIRLSSDANISVEALNGSTAAADLGLLNLSGSTITSRDLIAGLNTVLLSSLSGGRGVGGTLTVEGAGGTLSLDVTGIQTLQALIDRINAESATTGISARINAVGNGIEFLDTAPGAGSLRISGQAAVDLRLIDDANGKTFSSERASANAQLRYFSAGTHLAELNGGRGIERGKFRITNSNGVSAVVDLTQGDEITLQNVIDEINSRFSTGQKVVARINDNGDGLILEDQAGGAGKLTVTEEGGKTARDLGILGTSTSSEAGSNLIDGSFEVSVSVSPSDSLRSLAARLSAASNGRFRAQVINDGSSGTPYRLSLNSLISGTVGRIGFDATSIGLDSSTLVEARDALVLIGSDTQNGGLLVTSSSNSVLNVLPGVTLNLSGTSTNPVTITVAQNVNGLVENIKTFVNTFNDAVSRLDALTAYNQETGARGVLLGDSGVSTIRSRLTAQLTSPVGSGPDAEFASTYGISLGRGGKIELNETRLREALAADPEAVQQFFTTAETGFATRFEKSLDDLTRSFDGLLAQRDQTFQNRADLLTSRIDSLNVQLARKSARLTAQFQAMEQALSNLQSQQTALSGLANLLAQQRT